MNKDKVEVLEIWMPVEEGGEARTSDGKNLKLIAYIVNGYPIRLETGFALERRFITKEEEKRILESNAKLINDML